MAIDIVADGLNKIKLYERLGKKECIIHKTKIVAGILEVLKQKGYVENYVEEENRGKTFFKVLLKGAINELGVIKPRHPVAYREWFANEAQYLPAYNIGVLIVSTEFGIVSNQEAKERKIGGKLIAYAY